MPWEAPERGTAELMQPFSKQPTLRDEVYPSNIQLGIGVLQNVPPNRLPEPITRHRWMFS